MGFNTTSAAMILGLATPLAEAMGVPITGNLMETAEDFAALENVGIQVAEFGKAGKEALADGRLTAEEIQRIIKEAQDPKDALAALGGEIKDRTLGSTPETRAAEAEVPGPVED